MALLLRSFAIPFLFFQVSNWAEKRYSFPLFFFFFCLICLTSFILFFQVRSDSFQFYSLRKGKLLFSLFFYPLFIIRVLTSFIYSFFQIFVWFSLRGQFYFFSHFLYSVSFLTSSIILFFYVLIVHALQLWKCLLNGKLFQHSFQLILFRFLPAGHYCSFVQGFFLHI